MKHPLVRFAEEAFGEIGYIERSFRDGVYTHTFVEGRRVVDLTYFIGRPFVDVVAVDDEVWVIQLEAGGLIKNLDAEREIPAVEDLAGTQLLRPIFSELDTRLQFGLGDTVRSEVVLTPTKYTVSDPIYGEQEEYPQVPAEIEDTLPPDPSDERVAEGPDEIPDEEGEEEP